MKTKDLTIQESLFHTHADACLVRGILRDEVARPRAARHVVGWIARAAPQTLLAPRRCLDAASAIRVFQETLETDDVPPALVRARDWQKKRVYDWENELLVPQAEPVEGVKTARAILRQVARDLAIPCPKLVWREPGGEDSEYDDDCHEISFGHREKISLLHEMAHAVHAVRTGERLGPHHSPGFVWIAIELYHRYADVDLWFLVQSAAHRDLLGDIVPHRPDAPPLCRNGAPNGPALR